MSNLAQVYLGLGTNLGDRSQNLEIAIQRIVEWPSELIHQSSIYETEAWGIVEQPCYLNQVIEIRTTLKPQALLKAIGEIEKAMGRERIVKWRERIIDIDILFYDNLILESKELTIPHPYIPERNFVLYPMVELAKDLWHPKLGLSMAQLLKASTDTQTVQLFKGDKCKIKH